MSADLSPETVNAIRNRIKHLQRRQLTLLVETEGDTGTLWLVRHMTNEKLVKIGTVDSHEKLTRLAEVTSQTVDALYNLKEMGML